MKKIRILKNGQVLFDDIDLAESFFSRGRGLLGRDGLSDGQGMLLTKCRSIHTVGMRCAIDVVFLSSAWKVLSLAENVKPWQFKCGPAHSANVLEVATGSSNALGLEKGDQLVIEPREA